MNDEELTARIGALVEEEHRIEHDGLDGALSDADRARLREIDVALDQCWDLLRQRRARREFGADPELTSLRPPDVVEQYEQ
jgi:hypothetical protein